MLKIANKFNISIFNLHSKQNKTRSKHGTLFREKGLIFGLANKDSIAWGISKALHDEGAELGFSYAGEILKKRVEPLAESINATFVEECDVTSDEAIDGLFAKAQAHFGTLDFIVHAVAFAPREALSGRFVNTEREQFRIKLDISCYSMIAIAKRARLLMPNGGSMVTMTWLWLGKGDPQL